MQIRRTLQQYPPLLLILFGLIALGFGLAALVQQWVYAVVRGISNTSLPWRPTRVCGANDAD